ncbi:MAG: hypothetical protein U0174_22565 [Polyangiaceae bacterium]
MRMKARAFGTTLFALSTLSANAWADRVLVFPFHEGAPKPRGAVVDEVKSAPPFVENQTRTALGALKHTMVAGEEEAKARAAVKDGVADTSEEFREAGNLASADWTLVGSTQPTEDGVRVELFVYQVKTARLESLVRELQGSNREAQLEEMLARLLSATGIGTGDIVWNVAPKYGPGEKPRHAEEPTTPKAPPDPNAWFYGKNAPFSISAGLGGYVAAARPSNATGDSFTLNIEGALGYVAVKSLELRANVGVGVIDPKALHVDGGARYAFTLSPGARLYAGPELSFGMFMPIGGDKTARFLARGAGFFGVGFGEHAQVEAMAELFAAPGGSGALVLVGGSLRGGVRF